MRLQIFAAVLSGMLLAGLGGGLTVWKDVSVLSERVSILTTTIQSTLDDHEARIRIVERGR